VKRAAALVFVAAVAAAAGCATQVRKDAVKDPGERIFNGYAHDSVQCWRCHSGDASGTLRGPNLATRVPLKSNEDLFRTIHHGFGDMPGFGGKLEDAEFDAIVAWLRTRFPKKS